MPSVVKEISVERFESEKAPIAIIFKFGGRTPYNDPKWLTEKQAKELIEQLKQALQEK